MNVEKTVYRARCSERIFRGMKNTSSDEGMVTWTLDPVHTSVGFSVRHMMITNVRGTFERVSGTVRYDANRPEVAEIHAAIAAASVNTREPQRDAHLRSGDFFDVEKHPTITFQSTRVRASIGAKRLEVIGNLTIRERRGRSRSL